MALELKRKKKEQEQLQEQSMINQTLKDEIDKEVKNSAIVQLDYQKRILQLQNTAMSLCKFIETEKKKNVVGCLRQTDLKTIIDHLSKKHNQDGSENMEDLVKRQQKMDYDIDQIVQKQNESHAQINELKERVNAARTERVIYSGVFKNIEREIRQSEEEFKILLIQRFNAEKRKEEAENQYKKNKEDAVKRNISAIKANLKSVKDFQTKIVSTRDISSFSAAGMQLKQAIWQASSNNQGSLSSKDRKFIELQKEGGGSGNNFLALKRSVASTYKSDSITSCQLTLNKIKSDTGIECNDLIYYLDNINKINNEMFEESNKLIDQIDQTDQKILKLQSKRLFRKTPTPPTSSHPSRLRQLEDNLQSSCCKTQNEFNELEMLSQNPQFTQVLKTLKIQRSPQQKIYDLPDLFIQISEKMGLNMLTVRTERESQYEGREDLKEEALNELIDHSDKSKECEKIMLLKEMQEYCNKELNMAKDTLGKKSQNRQQWKKKKLAA